MKYLVYIFALVVFSCSPSSNEKKSDKPSEWLGNWAARWEMSPQAYPDMKKFEFYMNGVFGFTKDSLTIRGNGFPNCVFGIDTLSYTQSWYVVNDTLFLTNKNSEIPGISYQIVKKEKKHIKLQLVDDIFVTLTK